MSPYNKLRINLCGGSPDMNKIAMLLLLVLLCTPPVAAESLGGPEVIMQNYPGSGMVLVAVSVRAGSVYETTATRGATHYLEHLLFDGSERYSREEITAWTENNGVFLNAFTRKEVTVYFLLARSELLEQSIEILSQMLLYPVFTGKEMEKERKVVLEEMRHSLDDPDQVVGRMAQRFLYRGSALAEPVLGYTTTIEAVTREEIRRYHGSYYVPSRMRVLLMGDYDVEQAAGWVEDYFPGISGPAVELPAPQLVPRWGCHVTRRHHEKGDGLDLLVRVPQGRLPEALLLEEMLSMPSSPLKTGFEKAGMMSPKVYLEIHEAFSAFRISADVPDPEVVSGEAVRSALASLADWRPDEKELEGAKMALLSSDMLDREKYHYYLMLRGELIGIAGKEYFEALDEIGGIGKGDAASLVKDVFGRPLFNGFLTSPAGAVTQPRSGSKPVFEESGEGITFGALRRAGSGIASLCVLFPRGGGESSLLHCVLDHISEDDLDAKLTSLGARVQWRDNPYIPMDDYLVSPSWSFLRLEAPSGRIAEATGMLVEFLSGVEITEDNLGAAMGKAKREFEMRSSSERSKRNRMMRGRLFSGHRYGEPDFRAEIDAAGLEELRGAYHFQNGIVVTMVSPLPEGESLEMLKGAFSSYSTGENLGYRPLPPGDYEPGVIDGESGGEGAWLAAGWMVPAPGPEKAAALSIACEILSRRMQLSIRETEGLSYSTGSSATHLSGASYAVASLSTRGENLDKAMEALEREISSLSGNPPSSEEISIARSRILSRMARRRMSSANEALFLALDRHIRGGEGIEELISSVGSEEILRLTGGLLTMERAVVVRLLPSDGAPEKKSMPPAMMR
jgi:predicted Zn-dependent peptidase